MSHRISNTALVVLLLLMCSSCDQSNNPERGFVKGKVTMNGKPVTGADLEAAPVRGRPAYGVIQPDGSYEIMYKKNVPGTVLGKNKFTPIWPTGVRGPAFPPEYLNIEIDVQPGENTYVLEMKSDQQGWIDFKPLTLQSAPSMASEE